jgi:hypothetical protein
MRITSADFLPVKLQTFIQNFSAISQGDISLILSRNLKDYRKSELLIMSPQEYCKAHLH